MRHKVFGKKLSRTKNERRRLLMNLARQLIIHEHLTITHAKAKAVRAMVEKLITNAKKQTNAGSNQVKKVLADKLSSNKLIRETPDRFKNRPGGYLRIVKLGNRLSDASSMVRLEFVDNKKMPENIATSTNLVSKVNKPKSSKLAKPEEKKDNLKKKPETKIKKK